MTQLLLPCLLLLTPSDPAGASAQELARQLEQSIGKAAVVSTDYLRSAKLRKLHLVRPDLIPYPLAFEVYC